MLVLSRKAKEVLVITVNPPQGGPPVTFEIAVVESDACKARIGIDADPDVVKVLRKELLERE